MTDMRGGHDLSVVMVLLECVLISYLATLTQICCSQFSSWFGRSNKFYGSIRSPVQTLGQAVPGESLSLLEQVGRENASWRLGLGGCCKYNWEPGPTPSQISLPDPAQPRFSKCVYFKAAGVLKAAYVDLFHVPQTLAVDLSIHHGGGI